MAENWNTPTLELGKLADSYWFWVKQAVNRINTTPQQLSRYKYVVNYRIQ
ncbi:MAG: hypothetical protein WBA93_08165 [Microcoleaceae cyanobacterium]